MLFRYVGNMAWISWNCSNPEAKFNCSDCCAAVTASRQTRIPAICTNRILVLPWTVPFRRQFMVDLRKNCASSQSLNQKVWLDLSMSLQLDQVLDLDRATAAFN